MGLSMGKTMQFAQEIEVSVQDQHLEIGLKFPHRIVCHGQRWKLNGDTKRSHGKSWKIDHARYTIIL